MRLYIAALPLGDQVSEKIIRALLDLANKADAHWRTRRNLVDALVRGATASPAFVASLTNEITDDKTRRKALRALDISA